MFWGRLALTAQCRPLLQAAARAAAFLSANSVPEKARSEVGSSCNVAKSQVCS